MQYRTCLLSLCLLVGLNGACSSDSSSEIPIVGSAGTVGAGNVGGPQAPSPGSGMTASGGTTGGGTIVVSAGGASGATSGQTGNGTPELCDGIDNNANGIVDDRDVGQDGICDCLRIATLGKAGPWGQGDVFGTWLNSRSDSGAVDLNDQVLTSALLAPFQVIVVQDLSKMAREYAPDEVQAFLAWLRGGKGAMTLIGYGSSSERTNVNLLLKETGLSYDAAGILQKRGGNTIPIRTWTPHPVTNGIKQIGMDNGYAVLGATPALASEQGSDILRATDVGSGHLLVWGDEWITYNSEWSGHPEYQVELFWVNAIKWLTPLAECQVPIPDGIPR